MISHIGQQGFQLVCKSLWVKVGDGKKKKTLIIKPYIQLAKQTKMMFYAFADLIPKRLKQEMQDPV